MSDLETLEKAASELVAIYGLASPPVPIEDILQNPRADMWKRMDITQLSGTFLSISHRYSPRMSLARMLVRHVAYSQWGKARGVLEVIEQNEDLVPVFARMLIMPRSFVKGLPADERDAETISERFQVPDDDASARLEELGDSI
jgi:hypothetical protein